MLDVVPPKRCSRRATARRGLTAEYFKSQHDRRARRCSRGVDPTVDANWKDGAPRADMNADDFGVRWTGTLRPPQTGTYRLGLVGTMKFQLYLDDSLDHALGVSDARRRVSGSAARRRAAPMHAARRHDRIAFASRRRRRTATRDLQFVWSAPHDALEAEAIDAAQQADAVVMFLGLTARLEGEEMPVQIDGFRGGDRTSIDLPAPQQRLLERIAALGKPTVLVLLNGSARRGELGAGPRAGDRRGVVSGPGRGHGDRRRAVRRLQPGAADCR